LRNFSSRRSRRHSRNARRWGNSSRCGSKKHVEARQQAASTRHNYINIYKTHLGPRLGAKRLDEVTSDDIAEMTAYLSSGGREAKTVNNVLSVLSSVLRKAYEWKVTKVAPPVVALLSVDTAPEREFYDFDEYTRLVAAAEGLGVQQAAAVRLMGDAGLRTGECLALRWGAIRLQQGLIVVSAAAWRRYGVEYVEKPKGGRTRRVPVTPELRTALQRLEQRGPEERVFFRVGKTGEREAVSEQTLRSWVDRAQGRAGVRRLGKHGLRHTFCSHLAMLGTAPATIQRLAGHESLETTQQYMHLAPGETDRAIASLSQGREGRRKDDSPHVEGAPESPPPRNSGQFDSRPDGFERENRVIPTTYPKCPRRDSNPCYRLERPASWASRRRGPT